MGEMRKMLIKKITIHNFGKIHNRTFDFSEGINVLYGENESGKTTVHTFIKGMLYGIPRLRGRAAANDVYRTYEPWENPGEYGGVMWFESGGMSYRLTRNFSRERPFAELLCEDTGALVDPDSGALDEILGNVSEAVYDNTVSVGQMKSVTGRNLVRELQNYMAGYEGGADSTIDIERASQMLKMTRKGYQVQESHRKKALEAEQIRIRSGIGYLEEEEKKLAKRERVIRHRMKEMSPAGEEENAFDAKILKLQQNTQTYFLLSIIAAVLLFIVALVLKKPAFRAVSGGAAALVLVYGFLKRNSMIRETEKLKIYKEKWEERYAKLSWDLEQTKRMLDEKRSAIENMQEELDEGEDALYQESSEQREVKAINLALETITALSGNINARIGSHLRTRTSRILSGITGGKYSEVLMDENLRMAVNTGERVVPLERLSRGTLEQIYFALRMAAGELFCGGTPFPVILDDVFGSYDVERLQALLRWLHNEDRQVMISTCSGREAELLREDGITFNEILL